MADTNYISGIVKILENPKQKLVNKTIPVTEFRVQLPQFKNNTIVNLVFWGNLGKDVTNYYKLNDYIIIEGYLSLKNKKTLNLSKRVTITVLKIYPFLLSSSHFGTKG
uniref:hypothetical protein n=1 Tax=Bacillaria paxillifer TaxID=3003 RepID=UPI001EF9DB14|nr:hypothetical protein MKU43_pgp091 [Bacillaria paxillifer]ULD16534.1 hypothetical protein [Bacillaria paxillifer]